ncbi:hypothetical protein WA026_016364 [Henosepilachna vigintioctopunctata]|uniref:Uncharacterized protein n=1 Tax=Henosepilachna vigintioctopunctata TaxID=420089 RepID=A0AAW1UNE8_9CUCU
MNELRRNKRMPKYGIKKPQSIPVLPKKSVLLTHNLSTNISVSDLPYISLSNEVGCQKSRNNSNIHIYKPTQGFGGLKQNFAVNTESTKISLSQTIQVVPNNHANGDFIHRNWKGNYRSAEMNFQRDYVNLQSNHLSYRKIQPLNNTHHNKTSLTYPDVNFHVMSMLLPHLNESLYQNCEGNYVQNKTFSRRSPEENSESCRDSTRTEGYTQSVECLRGYVNQKKEEKLMKNYYRSFTKITEKDEQKEHTIKHLTRTTSKCNIFSSRDFSTNIREMMEIMHQMKQFLDIKLNKKSYLKQSSVFLNEIIEVKHADDQENYIPSKQLELHYKPSVQQMKISDEIPLKLCNKEMVNTRYNYESETKFEVFLLKKKVSISTNTLCYISSSKNISLSDEMNKENIEHSRIISKSIGIQFSGKYPTKNKKIMATYYDQNRKKESKVLLKAKQLVSSSEIIGDIKLSLSSEMHTRIFNNPRKEPLWNSDNKRYTSKNIDYYQTNILDFMTNPSKKKIFDSKGNSNVGDGKMESKHFLERHTKVQNKIAPRKYSKEDIDTIFSTTDSTSSSTFNIPLMRKVPSEYSKFNLREPYCRNYYVYYSRCIPYVPVVLGDMEISLTHMKNGIRLLKCIQFLNQQYKCLESIAQSILLLTNLMEKIYNNNNKTSFCKCFDGVYAIQKHFNDVISINKLMRMKMFLQKHVDNNRNFSLLGYKVTVDKKCRGRFTHMKTKSSHVGKLCVAKMQNFQL